MQYFKVDLGRAPVVVAWLALAGALSSCATPEGYTPPVSSQRVVFNTGRLAVVVVDQYGAPIYGARIDVDADEPEFYRNSGTLDLRGEVMFSGVPEEVRVTVQYPGAYYSRPFSVSPTGTTEMRMIVMVEDSMRPQPPQQPRPVPRPQPSPSPGGG